MKRTILLTFLLIVSITSFSKGAQSWVQELDLVDLSTLEKDNVTSFWTAERNADNDYTSLQEAVQKNKKSIRTARSNINKFLFSSYSDRADIVIRDTMADSICSYIERDLHLDEIRQAFPQAAIDNLEIRIAANNEFNASTFPDGYILINTGLFSKLTYNELLAVCAHELVHYMFNHSLANEYAYIKKQKSNKLWAEIGGGLLMGASAFADGYSAGLTGQQTNNSEYYASMYQGIIDDAAESAERFKFRYSRKDELQADVIGFRYLQYLGYDPKAFLTMLEKIGTENDKYYGKKSSHPKTKLRIEVIKALLGESTE